MKYMYVSFQRSAFLCLIVLWLVTLASNPVYAQQQTGFESGVVRIKVSEALANQLESARPAKGAGNILVTGIQSIDRLSLQYKATGIKRVFRPAGKFEAKHRKYGLHRWYEVQLDKAAPILNALKAYQAIDQIEIVQPLYKKEIIGSRQKDFGPRNVMTADQLATLSGAPNDPLFAQQWHYNNTGQASGTPGSDISLIQAWGIETGSSNVIVAVTDGGAQVNHPDLAANMWVNTDEIPGNGIDDDNNGYVDDINGYGFGDDTGEIAPDDHGTHTSGTIAATTNNGIGVAGVAGGSGVGDGVRIMSCAAFGAVGVGGFEDTYVYAADNGAVISQNSWGYTNAGVFDQAVLDGIDYFIAEAGKDELGNQVGLMNGGIVIFSAGNDDDDGQHYPGFYESTLAVSGVTNQDKKAWYSNFGTWVDLAAPGGETFVNNDPRGVLSTVSGGNYAFFQGTSMACPHVSGVAALIVSKFGGPGLTPEMVRGRLTQLVDDIDDADPSFAGLLGSGRLNAFLALQENDGSAPEPISDLAATNAGVTDITLTWTAPLDSGNGSASVYDIRYSTAPITDGNFGSATVWPNPPVPQPAGTPESVTITGLLPGTVYYFAIKSADFFGNFSSVSNIVEQATDFAPVISVSPTSLVQNLQTAETATQSFTVTNDGLGVLDFALVVNASFAEVSPVMDTLAPGASKEITVTFDAAGLLAGTYTGSVDIVHNDPLQDSVSVDLTLNVTNNGLPIASVYPDTLNFGDVFETDTATLYVNIHNAGSEPLTITSASSDNSDFVVDFPDSIIVAPFATATIPVIYTASSLGISAGTVTITTNDSANPSFVIAVIGNGVVAPTIIVSPESLSATLNSDKTETQSLTIGNTGGSNLEFSISVSSAAPASVAAVKTISLPTKPIVSAKTLTHKAAALKSFGNQIKLKSVGKSAVASTVLIVTPDDNVSDIESVLNGFEDISATTISADSLPLLSLAKLNQYDIVFTTNNTQWLGSGGIDPETVGNLLADYIDAGGKVIVNQFAYSYDAWQMAGRFIDEGYGPFVPSTTDAVVDVELGTILTPGHPILEGVSSLIYSGFVQNVGLAPGAIALAEWSNGELFLAANSNVVALNMLPSLGNGDPLQWDGDLPTILQNAVHYLNGGGSFVSVSPTEGVVAPGEQVDLEVTFNSSGLDAGVYSASIDILNNTPLHELISVPATLTVLGPEFTVSPDSLYDELERQQTSTHTLILSNNGPDDHTFTVSVQGGGYATSSVKITKPSATVRTKAPVENPEKKKQQRSARKRNDRNGIQALTYGKSASGRVAARSAVSQNGVDLYATDFESLLTGDINGQDNWFGQWGNWTVESENPSSGAQHFRGLADGLGFSASISPSVAIGSDSKSTTTMKVNLQGSNVTWQIVPQSPSAGLVVTRIQFEADGSISALLSDGAGGGAFETIAPSTPSGYFDFTIEADRATATFDVLVNNTVVFSGQGFAGNIEEVAVLSWMEEAGPTLDIDDFKIIDGSNEPAPEFIAVNPLEGNLPAGSTAEITVTFTSGDLKFGLYSANINIDIDGTELNVPAKLRVVGDEAIDVDPTVLQAVVDYQGDTTKYIHISNTGGRPLTYGLQVIGASTDLAKLPAPVTKATVWTSDKRIMDKKAKDDKASKPVADKSASVKLLAGTSLLDENFDGGTFPPAGWSAVDIEGEGVNWGFAADVGEGNYSGTGEAATISSDAFGPAEFDAVLTSPAIRVAGYKNIAVQYNANYANYANLDFFDLEIQVDDGAWATVLSWNEDHGTFADTPGEFVSILLDSYLDGASSFRLRWHYYDPNTDDWDWYAQIDDVVVLGDSRQWLTVDPAAGTIPVGESVDIAARFDAEDLEPGTYVAGIIVTSNAVEDPLVGVVASLQVRNPAVISVDPDSVHIVLPDGLTTERSLTITNTGESVLYYSITDAPIPTASGRVQARREPTETRTARSPLTGNLQDIKAFVPSVKTQAALSLYSTGFEEFATGDVNGQNDWAGQAGNWTIESFNPAEGAQHLSGLADGLGQSLAFSPEVLPGGDDISTATMKIDFDPGVTWQIIPQSPTAGMVNTRFQISADGSLSTLVQDSVGNVFYQPIPGTLPDGYFDFRIEISESTLEFTIYVNDDPIFTGNGFAGDIEQVVLFSLMEDAGQLLNIDNLAILDGPATTPWLTVQPESGAVVPGGWASVNLLFDATDAEPGTYSKMLNISSNDPATPNVSVPVTLVILPNQPPVLSGVNDTTLLELSTINLVFTATDPDDSTATISVLNAPAFVTLVSSGAGYANYAVSPKGGDAGTYEITVTAEDVRGGSTSETFTLTVVPYGVQNFSLTYYKTGAVVSNFQDTVTLDIADPDLDKYTIQANTNPPTVGSVKFTLDGSAVNTDNSAKYTLDNWVLPKLSGGDHTFSAQAFTKSKGNGDAGSLKWGTIHMINSAAISDFDVVNPNGVKLLDLQEGAVIDISQAAFKYINFVANTSINTVRSVKFSLNGPTARIDNRAPFALRGNANGSDTFWAATPGSYTLTATPYMQYYGWGPEGTSLTVHFTIVNGSVPTVANARSTASDGTEESVLTEETRDKDSEWSVYPVPVSDELHIKFVGKDEGPIALNIMNLQGQSMHMKDGSADTFRDYTISTTQIGLRPGFYLVQIKQANGTRVIKKFTKE